MNVLSPKETEFVDSLKDVSDKTMWGLSLHVAISHPTLYNMKELIASLKQAHKEHPKNVEKILGPNIYPKFITLIS